MAADMAANAHVSAHPCVRAKMSLLRSDKTNARDTKGLVNEIALMVGCDALAHALRAAPGPPRVSPLGYEYTADIITPQRVSIMPILRSGLAMVDAVQTLLPEPVPVHHLGLYRDKSTMSAVEYYNNLRHHGKSELNPGNEEGPSDMVILVDPVIATGATACAAIETLREWGVQRIVVLSIIASRPGLARAAEQWPEGVEIWTGAMDEECDASGMIKPGVGDIGDRLFLTLGK